MQPSWPRAGEDALELWPTRHRGTDFSEIKHIGFPVTTLPAFKLLLLKVRSFQWETFSPSFLISSVHKLAKMAQYFLSVGKVRSISKHFSSNKVFFFFFFLPTPQIIRKLFHYHIYVLQVWLWVLILTSMGKNFEYFNLFHDFKDWLESIGERAHFNAVLMFRCFWCLDGLGSLAGDSQLKMFTPWFFCVWICVILHLFAPTAVTDVI